MAITLQSSNHWVLSVKVLLLSTGIMSMAMILKLSVPAILQFLVSGVPLFWTSLLSWLTPPYLYVVINGIIITIAATSRFHHKTTEDQHHSETLVPGVPVINKTLIPDSRSGFVGSSAGYDALALKNPLEAPPADFTVALRDSVELGSDFTLSSGYEALDHQLKNPMVVGSGFGYEPAPVMNLALNRSEFQGLDSKEAQVAEAKIFRATETDQIENEFVISRSNWTPSRRDSTEIRSDSSVFSENKPPASSRFSHRKPVKASPEGGKALRAVTKPKRHETLENTWKAITDGRPMPLTRHQKKSDTWESHARHNPQSSSSSLEPAKAMKKSETFRDRVTCNNENLNPIQQEEQQQQPAAKVMKKSETFTQGVNMSSPGSGASGGGKLRKEPSLSQDDLNRRVEAFINKFNEEMRLQRQESLNQYKEMVSRGTH